MRCDNKEHTDLGIVERMHQLSVSFTVLTPSPAGCISSNAIQTHIQSMLSPGEPVLMIPVVVISAIFSHFRLQCSPQWKADYTGVQYANLSIRNITNMENILMKILLRNMEAHFLRALYYFDLLT